MRSKLVIQIEGSKQCHPEKELLEVFGEKIAWILQGKLCDDQEITIIIEGEE